MTNLGHLITTFVPAPSCTSIISGIVHTETFESNGVTNTSAYKYHSLGPANTTPCFPPAFRIASDAFYSPGICPQGWTSACGSIEVIGVATETRATCCPLGYTCQAAPPATATWSTLSCITTAISVLNVTVPDLSNQQSRVVELQPVINVAAVNVRWQQTDFVTDANGSAIQSSLSPPPSQSPSETGTSPTDSSTQPSETSPPGSNGLTTNAKIGIGVGVGVGALIILAVLGFFIWQMRRRKNGGAGGATEEKPPDGSGQAPNSPGEGPADYLVGYPGGVIGNYSGEAWVQQLPPEFETQFNRHELKTQANTHEMKTLANLHEINEWRDTASFAHRPLPPPPQTHLVEAYAPGAFRNRATAEMP